MLRPWNTVIALALVPLFRATESAPRPVAVASCWGDVNGDTKVDVADALLVGRYAIGMHVAGEKAIIARGDVTGDGRVNVADAQQIARYGIGLPSARRLSDQCRVQAISS